MQKKKQEEDLQELHETLEDTSPHPTANLDHFQPSQNLFSAFGGDTSSSEEEKEQEIIKANDEDTDTVIQEVEEVKEIQEEKISAPDDVKTEELPIDDNLEINDKPKPKKKKKRKKKKKKQKIEDNEEELEKKEEESFWAKFPIKHIYQYEENVPRFNDLLEINTKSLNYIKEMEKLFDTPSFSKSSNNSMYDNMNKKQANLHREHMKKFKPRRKYFLVHNEDVKIKLNDKLDMEVIRTDNNNKFKFYAFKSDGKLSSLQETYKQVKNTYDINSTIDFLYSNPYFPEALYDLGEYLRLKSNYKDANYNLEKMMFFYENSFNYEFKIFESNLEPNQDSICLN